MQFVLHTHGPFLCIHHHIELPCHRLIAGPGLLLEDHIGDGSLWRVRDPKRTLEWLSSVQSIGDESRGEEGGQED